MRGNMETKFFLSLFAVIAFLHGVSADGSVSVSVMEGDSVTIKTGVKTKQQEKIKWYFNDTLIARINGDLSDICTDVHCDESNKSFEEIERFRDRLKLNNQTGSLTIMNIRTTHSGVYKAVILNISNTDEIFHVTVHDAPAPVSVKEGESVTLGPGVINGSNDVMIWSFRGSPIAEIRNQSKIFIVKQGLDAVRFRGRLNMNQTGSLTITNSRTTDCGLYQLQIINSRFNITRSFCVCVTANSINQGVETSRTCEKNSFSFLDYIFHNPPWQSPAPISNHHTERQHIIWTI